MHQELQSTRRSRLTAVLIGAALLTFGGAGTAAYADTPDPQLSIAVDNGSTTARDGDELGYTITVTNLGTRKVKDLRVSQTVPAGAAFVSADADGDHARGKVSWSVDLAAAGRSTLHTTLAVRSTPDSALRLASVACAQVSSKSPPLVCASDSDQLPAGAAVEQAEAQAEVDAAAPVGWFEGLNRWYVAGSGAVVLAALGAVLATRRRQGAGVRAAE